MQLKVPQLRQRLLLNRARKLPRFQFQSFKLHPPTLLLLSELQRRRRSKRQQKRAQNQLHRMRTLKIQIHAQDAIAVAVAVAAVVVSHKPMVKQQMI